jgi:hypothetical protein
MDDQGQYDNQSRYGNPLMVRPRLGQGSFRVLVTETYQRRCALTGEKTLPVLEAAHIKPYAELGRPGRARVVTPSEARPSSARLSGSTEVAGYSGRAGDGFPAPSAGTGRS